jgi:glycosyltransferase involved in cell wall biosynthesis
MLTLDVAIVTRNRPQVLDLSLPLLLNQSRKPKNIFIVDSSDDSEAVPTVLKKHSATTGIPIEVFRSPAGIAVQRNIALKHITSDIVMFPDDDSLLLPGALDAIMRVYEADVDERIGGVCGLEVLEAPADVLSVARRSYEMTRLDRMKQKLARQRFLLERRFLSDPIKIHGRSRWNVCQIPEWLDKENSVVVEYMTGFRMSFRANVIKQYGFNESLGRYALFEDIDASFSVMKNNFVVAAKNARIFHYKSPENRDSGRTLGILHILNRAYVVCRHAEHNSLARQHIRSFSRSKLALYATELNRKFGRERFNGALRAYLCLPQLLKAAPDDLTNTYLELREYCLKGK